MGKEKKLRRNIRSNPLGTRRGLKSAGSVEPVSVSKELQHLQTEEASASLGISLEELVQKLQSPVADDRTSAAVILANLSSNPSTINTVGRVDIIKFAAPLLLDSNIHVRLSVSRYLGAISNCGHLACDKLLTGGVVPIVGEVLTKVVGCDWTKIDKGHSTVVGDSLYLLEKLCWSSDEAVEIFNKQNYIDIVLPMLNVQTTHSFTISAAAGMCLLAVTEDNPELEERLKSEIPTIKEIIQYNHTSMAQFFMKALGVALLYNLEDPSSDSSLLFESLREILEKPTQELTALVSEKIVKVTEVERARDLEVENLEKMHKDVDFHVSELGELLRAKKMALEVLANLCCYDDDDDDENDEWNDMESDGDSSRTSADETMDTGTNGSGANSPDFLRTIRVSKFLPLIFSQTADLLPEQNEAFRLAEGTRSLSADFKDVRVRAYLCIDNMFQRLRVEDFGGAAEVHELFSKLMKAMIGVCRVNKEFFDVSSSAVRGVLDCVLRAEKSMRPNITTCVNGDELMLICQTAQEGRCASTTMNVCRIITSLALLEASLVAGAVEFLYLVATSDPYMRICTEAFDCIIDLFSSDDYDGILHEFQLLEKLKRAIPNFQSQYRAHRKGESRMLAATCDKNLRRFIKYKSERRLQEKKSSNLQ